jgi:N4-gp56 family major capsid protein
MSLDGFIPQIWSARLLANLHKALIAAQPGVVNREYEGEAQLGNTVKINSIGPVTVGDYTKNTDHAAPETLTEAQRSLLIDQAKFFNFQVDDIDQFQQKPKVMDEAMREAAYALADVLDQYILSKYVDAAAANAVGSTAVPVAVDETNAYSVLLQLGTKLTKQNIPTPGRWVILPPEWTERLLQDDRFVSFGTSENRGALENGVVGRAAGFDLLESNNVVALSGADAGKYKVMAGTNMAITLAEQIDETEAYRPERRFADAVKGLHVYGAKAIRPEALAVATVTFA